MAEVHAVKDLGKRLPSTDQTCLMTDLSLFLFTYTPFLKVFDLLPVAIARKS